MEAILAVTSKLAAPFELRAMLREVVSAAKQVLDADGGSVWLQDPATNELIIEVATGVDPLRVPAGTGIAGACARDRRIINVPDCYADARFNPEVDRRTGYRTRSMLALPLIDRGVLVGVMQVLNKRDGAFDADDEVLAGALAAQCAVALQRVRMTAALIEGEKLRQELEMARVVQMGTLPARMPLVAGYDVFGMCQPAGLTGGDTFDLAVLEQGLLAVLGDATGHGIAPALSVTQMQAMLRMAFRLGADLETAFLQVNNQLADTLADDRFITAFIGLLDVASHRLRFHSGGQAPILHFHAAGADFTRHLPTSFPLAAMPLAGLRPAVTLEMRPGDILVLLSDGIYEYCNAEGEQFGEERVWQVVRAHCALPAQQLAATLLDAVAAFAQGAPQEDDMTLVLLKRAGTPAAQRTFERNFASIDALVAFTADFFTRAQLDRRLLAPADLVVEELFTNMVKYGAADDPGAGVRIDMEKMADGLRVTMTDRGAEPFDVTRAPPVDVALPIEQRAPGGLGLHLVRKMVDSLDYEYLRQTRENRITFTMTLAGRPPADNTSTTGDA